MPADREVVEVTQEDREAAADLIDTYFQWNDEMHKLAEEYRHGYSYGAFVQAFARHRQASTASLNARVVELEKLFRRARNYVEMPIKLIEMEPNVDQTLADKHRALLAEIDTLLSESPSNVTDPTGREG